jgi:hypothetical protein
MTLRLRRRRNPEISGAVRRKLLAILLCHSTEE